MMMNLSFITSIFHRWISVGSEDAKRKESRSDEHVERTHQKETTRKSKYQATLREAAAVFIREASPCTRRNYLTALRSVAAFNGGRDIMLDQLRPRFVADYERWLLDRGVCPNTSSCYMRSLRALYNKVVERRRLRDQRPFVRVYTGVARTNLPVLDRNDINSLRTLELPPGSRLCMARDLFLFSLYAMGMPFVDMACLHKSQISGNRLVYYRHKTRQRVFVYLEPCMREIIKKYSPTDGNLVFPLLSGTGAAAHREYIAQLSAYNAQLKRLAKLAGLSQHISSYTPRRTWASLAYQRNVEVGIISRALGHTNIHTTRTYIKGENDELIRKINRRMLKSLSSEIIV